MEDTKGESLRMNFSLHRQNLWRKFTFYHPVECNSPGKSPEGRSREPLLQLQSLQAQDNQVS